MLEGIPIRWRLALLSAGLTLVILSGFAVVIGQVTSSRVRSDFNNEEAAAVDDLSDRIRFEVGHRGMRPRRSVSGRGLGNRPRRARFCGQQQLSGERAHPLRLPERVAAAFGG